MNIFVLDQDPVKAAEYLCDRHIIKMLLESTQLLCTVHRLGSTTQTRIFNIYLVTDKKPNICSRTIDIMAWSKDQVNAILGVTGGDDINEIDNIAMEDFDLLESNSTSSMQISNSLLNKW